MRVPKDKMVKIWIECLFFYMLSVRVRGVLLGDMIQGREMYEMSWGLGLGEGRAKGEFASCILLVQSFWRMC